MPALHPIIPAHTHQVQLQEGALTSMLESDLAIDSRLGTPPATHRRSQASRDNARREKCADQEQTMQRMPSGRDKTRRDV
jgi:hypothetical protein